VASDDNNNIGDAERDGVMIGTGEVELGGVGYGGDTGGAAEWHATAREMIQGGGAHR